MVYIGCDHAGYEIKNDIAKYLEENFAQAFLKMLKIIKAYLYAVQASE